MTQRIRKKQHTVENEGVKSPLIRFLLSHTYTMKCDPKTSVKFRLILLHVFDDIIHFCFVQCLIFFSFLLLFFSIVLKKYRIHRRRLRKRNSYHVDKNVCVYNRTYNAFWIENPNNPEFQYVRKYNNNNNYENDKNENTVKQKNTTKYSTLCGSTATAEVKILCTIQEYKDTHTANEKLKKWALGKEKPKQSYAW